MRSLAKFAAFVNPLQLQIHVAVARPPCWMVWLYLACYSCLCSVGKLQCFFISSQSRLFLYCTFTYTLSLLKVRVLSKHYYSILLAAETSEGGLQPEAANLGSTGLAGMLWGA